MRLSILLLMGILLMSGCAPAKITPRMPIGVQKTILTPRPGNALPVVYPTPKQKPTGSPVLPTQGVGPSWKALAVILQVKAQQGLSGRFWEDTTFKEDGYAVATEMIDTSTGKVKEDAREVLKKFRWGMELMDKGQLHEVIQMLDRYN